MRTSFTTALTISLAFVAFNASGAFQGQRDILLSSVEDFQNEFKSVPCKRQERLPAVRALFEKMGAKPEELTSQKQGYVENLRVRYAASVADTIIIGAHYDFIDNGCGAIDNWSGIVTLAHLYRTVRQFTPRKNIAFVAFDHEEDGLMGSRTMARGIGKADVSQYCAMINIDSFGLAGPFAMSNTSSPSLVRLSEETAQALKVPFYKVSIGSADADSSSFLARDIPAVTLSGLSNDWRSILHSSRDQVDKIQPVSVYLGYRLALSMWAQIDEAPCDAFRGPRR